MNIVKWITTVGDTSKLSQILKILFILTNFIYFLPIILYGVNDASVISCLIGIISTIYHSFQCNCHHSVSSKIMICVDSLVSITLFSYLIYKMHTKLTIKWYVVLVFTIMIYFLGSNKRGCYVYTFLHSMWHILSGCLLVYAASIYDQ